jgi:hypothetical protein
MNSADFTANVTQNYRKLGDAIQSLGLNTK